MATVNSPNSSVRVRNARTRTKTSSNKRSASVEDSKYIEHLEGELSAARNDHPSISQQHTIRMNRITFENRQLQAQLKDRELRYDEQIREHILQHTAVERTLRSQNESLEEYATRAKDRVVELETNLTQAQQALEAAETANVQLEKRIEIMSELLTSSPAKIDLHGDTPARKRMHMRPRSMLPRLPTAAPSWVGSPERGPEPLTSPAMSCVQLPSLDGFEPLEPIQSIDVSSPAETTSDMEAIDRPASARSSSFIEHLATLAAQSNTSQAQTRPMRRMRRFGAGSNGPKPLILPHASYEFNPTSAPPLERHEYNPSLPFRYPTSATESGWQPRCRTYTESVVLPPSLEASPQAEQEERSSGFNRILSIASHKSDTASPTPERRGVVSRSLLDELSAIQDDDIDRSINVDTDEDDLEGYETIALHDLSGSKLSSAVVTPQKRITGGTAPRKRSTIELDILSAEQDDPFNPALESILGPLSVHSPESDYTPRALLRYRSASNSPVKLDEQAALSTLDKLRTTFADILRSPTDFARVLVHLTQHRMHVPGPLVSVQWWLVSLLWGPMARSRMMGYHIITPHRADRPSPGSRTPSIALDKSVAYGTVSSSPLPSSVRRRAGMAGPGRKRVGATKTKQNTDSLLARHHPLLWAKFSLTLALAIGTAFTSGPGSLLSGRQCPCKSCQRANR